jgi:hypothetical protein
VLSIVARAASAALRAEAVEFGTEGYKNSSAKVCYDVVTRTAEAQTECTSQFPSSLRAPRVLRCGKVPLNLRRMMV